MITTNTLKASALGLLAAAFLIPATANAEDNKAAASAKTDVTQEHFTKADADRSGTLNENEYEAFADAQENADIDVASDFDDLDANDDKTLTLAEFKAQKHDADHVDDNY